jgi:hypothetical protein
MVEAAHPVKVPDRPSQRVAALQRLPAKDAPALWIWQRRAAARVARRRKS